MMTTTKRGSTSRILAVAFLGALLAGAAGCDYFKGSGAASRVSPFLSDLRVSRPSVLCDQPFQVIFDYDDPQDDISLLTVTFQSGAGAIREKQALWESTGDLNLATGGRASYTYAFACTERGGRWTVSVRVEDQRGHLSNTLAAEVSLSSAGG